jgi:hypothetical protein
MTTAAAEELIHRLRDPEAIGELLIPTKGKHHAAGGEASFVQALATWANAIPAATLRTYATALDDVQIERVTSRLYGLVATLLADRIMGRADSDLTETFRRSALYRLDELQSARPATASRGPQVEVLCVDHVAKSHPVSFYELDEEGVASVRRLPTFNEFVRTIVIPTIVPAQLRRAIRPGTETALGAALHELFRNTDEHGRGDDLGDMRRKSIRGIHARRHSIAPDALVALTTSSPPLAEYCRRLSPARAGNRDVQLIELAVFDAGPGLAASLAGRPIEQLTVDEEQEKTISCFRDYVSRKPSSSSGLGLPTVINVLRRQKGFLRVRTGRTALYSDLSLESSAAFGMPPNLRHWFSDGRAVAPVAGTLFTLLFPLEV